MWIHPNAGLTGRDYSIGMNTGPAAAEEGATPQGDLRAALVRSDTVLAGIGPILRHLLAHNTSGLFGEEIVARVRGLLADLARQLAHELGPDDEPAEPEIAAIAAALAENAPILAHLHALAIEWQLTLRLEAASGTDPVLPPLLQALIASDEPAMASTAMALLAAQARFSRSVQRMQLPLGELPGELLHTALAGHETAGAAIRARYDEGASRIGLLSRLVGGMGGGARAGLGITHAGVAIFTTALGLASGQSRDAAILACEPGQWPRLALALRGAGLGREAIAGTLLAIDPAAPVNYGAERLSLEAAAGMLHGQI